MKGYKNIARFFIPLVNLVKEGVTRSEIDRSLKIIRDGQQNDFPQYLTEIVYASPIARACIGRIINFVHGKGVHESIRDWEINKETGETFADFHEKMATDFSVFNRLAVKINPTRGGVLETVSHIPAEWVRYSEPDPETKDVNSVIKNPYWGTSEERRKGSSIKYPLWSMDPNKIREGIRIMGNDYQGHCLFFNITSPFDRNYSRPEFFSAEDWIRIDAKVGRFHSRNIENNFFLGGILTVFGDPDKGIMNEDGEVVTTVGERFNQELADTFSGENNAGSIFVEWVKTIGEQSVFQPYAGSQNHEMFTTLDSIILKNLAIAFGVPEILLGIPTAGKLGESNEIRNAVKFMNERTNKYRMKLESVYRKLFTGVRGFNVPEDEKIIQTLQDFTDLPEYVYQSLTESQRQDYLMRAFNIQPDETLQVRAYIPDTLSSIYKLTPNG